MHCVVFLPPIVMIILSSSQKRDLFFTRITVCCVIFQTFLVRVSLVQQSFFKIKQLMKKTR